MIVDDIRESVNKYIQNVLFDYGRPADTTLDAALKATFSYFVCMDPIVFTPNLRDNNEVANIAMCFLVKDKMHSQFDKLLNKDVILSVEEIQNNARIKSKAWLTDFLDNYRYQEGNITITPLTRVKDVMSGVGITFTLTYKEHC